MEDYQRIHDLQRAHMNDEIHKEARKSIHETWFKEDTVDYWRHERMYKTVEPLAVFYNNKKWLTVGDGRFGLDSYRLNKMYNVGVFPTDISKNMLAKASELGIIKEYGVENAEKLSFPDNSFDIVFCKESFHHFPRPIIALYEMIRVSKTAVILIEPNDGVTLRGPKTVVLSFIKMLLNGIFHKNNVAKKVPPFFSRSAHSFEESSNYVYTLSGRELEKIVIGANLKGLAYKGFNDFYVSGCEFAKADEHNDIFKTVRSRIGKMDARCHRLPLFFDWGLTTTVIFKEEIDKNLRMSMESSGFVFPEIPRNPHIN